MNDVKKTLAPSITDKSCMGGPRDWLTISTNIIGGLMNFLDGDNFKLVIEVTGGSFVVSKYPMESADTHEHEEVKR